MSIARLESEIDEHIETLKAIEKKLKAEKREDKLSQDISNLYVEAVALQRQELSEEEQKIFKDTLAAAVDFFKFPNAVTAELLQEQGKRYSQYVDEEKEKRVLPVKEKESDPAEKIEKPREKPASSNLGKFKKIFGVLGALGGGAAAMIIGATAAPVVIVSIALFLHQRRAEQIIEQLMQQQLKEEQARERENAIREEMKQQFAQESKEKEQKQREQKRGAFYELSRKQAHYVSSSQDRKKPLIFDEEKDLLIPDAPVLDIPSPPDLPFDPGLPEVVIDHAEGKQSALSIEEELKNKKLKKAKQDEKKDAGASLASVMQELLSEAKKKTSIVMSSADMDAQREQRQREEKEMEIDEEKLLIEKIQKIEANLLKLTQSLARLQEKKESEAKVYEAEVKRLQQNIGTFTDEVNSIDILVKDAKTKRNQKMQEIKSEVTPLQETIKQKEEVIREAQGELETAQDNVVEAEKAVEAAETARQVVLQKYSSLAEAREPLVRAIRSLEEKQRLLQEKQILIETVKLKLEEKQRDLEISKEQLKVVNQPLDELNKMLKTVEDRLKGAQGRVSKAAENLSFVQQKRERMEKEIKSIQERLSKSQGDLPELKKSLEIIKRNKSLKKEEPESDDLSWDVDDVRSVSSSSSNKKRGQR